MQRHDNLDKDRDSSEIATDLPRIELPANVEVWLRAAYERVTIGVPVDRQQMLVDLWSEIPDFDYKSIDSRLMRFGVDLTLIGILQIDPNTELCSQTDRVIKFIKGRIKTEPSIERMTAKEVSEAVDISETRAALIFLLMDHLGHFFSGAGGNGNIPGYTSITIRDEHVKREYRRYERLEPLLQRAAKQDEEQSIDTPPTTEFVHKLLDWKLAERLEQALHWVDTFCADHLPHLMP